jgi:D-alanyl-D-alanine carboxypeptidase
LSLHALFQLPGLRATPRWGARAAALLLGLLLAVWSGVAPTPLRAQANAAAATPAPECRYADVVTADAGFDQWATTIVDTELRLPKDYAPPDLVSVAKAGLAGSGRVRALVVGDLSKMAGAARAAGAELGVISAYRSEAAQRTVFADWERQVGHAAALLASARPGHSEHQLGTTIDFTTPDGSGPWSGDFGATAQGRWLHAHAAEFGFVESYPARSSPSLTCYQAEPWHFRYVGRGMVEAIEASGQPLRVHLYGRLPASGAAGARPKATATIASTAASGAPRPVPATDAPTPAANLVVVREAAAQSLPAVGIGVAIGIVLGRLGAATRALRRALTGTPRPRGHTPPRRR